MSFLEGRKFDGGGDDDGHTGSDAVRKLCLEICETKDGGDGGVVTVMEDALSADLVAGPQQSCIRVCVCVSQPVTLS